MTHGGSSSLVEVTRYQRAGRSEGRLAHALNPGARGPSRELGDAATTFAGVADLRDFSARPWIQATARRMVAAEIAQRFFLALVVARGRADHLHQPEDIDGDRGCGKAVAMTTVIRDSVLARRAGSTACL